MKKGLKSLDIMITRICLTQKKTPNRLEEWCVIRAQNINLLVIISVSLTPDLAPFKQFSGSKKCGIFSDQL